MKPARQQPGHFDLRSVSITATHCCKLFSKKLIHNIDNIFKSFGRKSCQPFHGILNGWCLVQTSRRKQNGDYEFLVNMSDNQAGGSMRQMPASNPKKARQNFQLLAVRLAAAAFP
jgi:hypothetical protein